jgi:hypothetical protein
MNFDSSANSEIWQHNACDPNPWLALYLDQSVHWNDYVKKIWLENCASASRQYFLPVARCLARIATVGVQILKILLPFKWHAPYFLHRVIVFSLNSFVSPAANWFILRHFHLGSEVLGFLSKNIEGVDIPTSPLKPMKVEELKDNLFVQHDINLYNFIIRLNLALREKNMDLQGKAPADFSMLNQELPNLNDMPKGIFNFLDVESAIELCAPLFQLLLTDSEYWRAAHSLQFDETIAIYATKILKTPEWLFLVNNRHPMVPVSIHQAAHRLVLHGIGTEILHNMLVEKSKAKL